MAFIERIKLYRKSRKKYLLTAVLGILVLALAGYSYYQDSNRTKLVYADSLEQTFASVNGQKLTLWDLAFYVAYEEALVENQALAYDADDTLKYWNLHTDGTFVRVAARNAAVQMAIHDEIFYQMAVEEKLELSEAEYDELAMSFEDFWLDLIEDEKEQKLGVDDNTIFRAMEKLMLAQKMQYIYAELQGVAYEDYDFFTDTYSVLKEQQNVIMNKNVIRRIGFGSITLEH